MQQEYNAGKRYFVTRKLRCPECQGTGTIKGAWRIQQSDMHSNGDPVKESMPVSEQMQNRCELCEGRGEVKTDVSFVEALVETLKSMVTKK